MVVELFLSVVAGAATAAAATKLNSLRSPRVPSVGANPRIRAELRTLDSERRILDKSIARLHDDSLGLSVVQRDMLLARYQNQLGAIAAHYEKLKEASAHPDLGSLGDGLVTLLDQKLSGLEEKFGELSSRILAQAESNRDRTTPHVTEHDKQVHPKQTTNKTIESSLVVPNTDRRVEITTLTTIPPRGSITKPLPPITASLGSLPLHKNKSTAPDPHNLQQPPVVLPDADQPAQLPSSKPRVPAPLTPSADPLNTAPDSADIAATSPPRPDPPMMQTPEPLHYDDEIDDGNDDDLAQIKKDISATLKRLEQAEVE